MEVPLLDQIQEILTWPVANLYLAGGFKYVLFSSLCGEDFQFD